MIRNYFVLTYRNLIKTKWLSLVNIGGLCLGISVGVLILNYVSYERCYDRFEFIKKAKINWQFRTDDARIKHPQI